MAATKTPKVGVSLERMVVVTLLSGGAKRELHSVDRSRQMKIRTGTIEHRHSQDVIRSHIHRRHGKHSRAVGSGNIYDAVAAKSCYQMQVCGSRAG